MDRTRECLYGLAEAQLKYLRRYAIRVNDPQLDIRDTHRVLLPYVVNILDEALHIRDTGGPSACDEDCDEHRLEATLNIGWRVLREAYCEDVVDDFVDDVKRYRREISRVLLNQTLLLSIKLQLLPRLRATDADINNLRRLRRWLDSDDCLDPPLAERLKQTAWNVRSFFEKLISTRPFVSVERRFEFELGSIDVEELRKTAGITRRQDKAPRINPNWQLDQGTTISTTLGLQMLVNNLVSDCLVFGECNDMPDLWAQN